MNPTENPDTPEQLTPEEATRQKRKLYITYTLLLTALSLLTVRVASTADNLLPAIIIPTIGFTIITGIIWPRIQAAKQGIRYKDTPSTSTAADYGNIHID